ncbi:Probable RNA polymerase sigma factor fecI [Pannonibacter phragmitetus]|uniref:Probable RNA polymerase sigma factor fecI n=1 Tax=Pannonibacter phragmitetus TaxID=121719 RepID=A0A378ZRA8_9HYPH|nr:RNA polymerase sigma factor [Pannonibacter phragmitetus]SUA99687.1 Probable RNA polymerase sigma factor fecI [Pannonibacter phragmitetus]
MSLRESDSRYAAYLAHRSALIDYGTRLLGSRADAEDVVQEAFIRFVPENSPPASSLRAYLFRIVRNLAFDIRRRRQLESREEPADLPHWTKPQDVQTPEEDALLCENLRHISEYLATLPPEVRTSLEMHRFGGYTLDEIGSHLGLSTATVHRHVTRTLAALAALLEPET